MRTFKNLELRLEKQDLIQLLEEAINKDVLSWPRLDAHRIIGLSLHPTNKYVIRITLTGKNRKIAEAS